MATQDDARNVLIVELGGRGPESPNLQGFSDERLVEMAAIVLFLMNANLAKTENGCRRIPQRIIERRS